MNSADQSFETLQDIKRMMERSSRFISLSGWSGISAGICALVGAWLAIQRIHFHHPLQRGSGENAAPGLDRDLIVIAAVVFIAALVSASFFTWLRSRRKGVPLWGSAARRLMWNTMLPMCVGGLVVLKLIDLREYFLIAPSCLIFYGLALVNGSKYTLGEVKYLGYGQVLLGLMNLWLLPGWGLLIWATGFGILHIIYGALMWWKYERTNS